jgi:hypothetical protein
MDGAESSWVRAVAFDAASVSDAEGAALVVWPTSRGSVSYQQVGPETIAVHPVQIRQGVVRRHLSKWQELGAGEKFGLMRFVG